MFTVTESAFGGYPTIVIEGDGARAVIARYGVTLLSWSIDGVDIIDGYAAPEELDEQVGVRSGIMAPYSNRIPAGRYTFDGRDYDYESGGETTMHGMLRFVEFEVGVIQTDATSATIHFTTDALRPGASAGYPFSVDVAIVVTVTANGIELTITATNVGEVAAPFASGWHPYFRIGDTPIEQLLLTIPARTRIVPGPGLIPLDGDDAFAPVEDPWDFSSPRAIGDQVIDMAFFDLQPAADGLIHTTLSDGTTTIDAWQERGGMHVFTADTVNRPRGSFAMESIEFMTNAVNRAEQADALRLEPGQTRSFRFGASVASAG